jgi:hypothetical protein
MRLKSVELGDGAHVAHHLMRSRAEPWPTALVRVCGAAGAPICKTERLLTAVSGELFQTHSATSSGVER